MEHALTEAIAASNEGTVRTLLGADRRLAADGSLLLAAVRRATDDQALPAKPSSAGALAVVDRLLDAGAPVTARDDAGWTALHLAAMCGNVPLIERLRRAGAPIDANAAGIDGFTPLALALFYAQTGAAGTLQDPRCPDNLRIAAALGDLARIASFFDGDTLRAVAGTGRTFGFPLPAFPPWSPRADRQEILDEALAWAARNGQVAAVEALVARGANVNANVARGTALLWATYTDKVAVAEWLLDHGADPDLRHDFGGAEHGRAATAMHLAAQYGAYGCLRLLLARGADATIRDGLYGTTPYEWGRFACDEESVRILAAAGHGPR